MRQTTLAALRAPLSAGILFLLSGCSLYAVRTATSTNPGSSTGVAGIPFFAYAAACKQQSVYEQHPYRLTLEVDSLVYNAAGDLADSVTLVNEEKIVSPDAIPVIDRMRQMVDRFADRPNTDQLVSAFRAIPVFDIGTDRNGISLVANTSEAVTYVDYSRLYFYNVRRPLIGSANATAEINANGTLAKGTADVTDNTTSAFLGLLPIKEFLTSKIKPSQVGATQSTHPPLYRYHLTIERLQVLHTASITYALASPCPVQPPIRLNPQNHGYSFTSVLGGAPAAAAAAKPANAITVTGQIALPQK
jgi:hypothetical protein